MGFRATNYSVSVLLLMAFTIGMMIVRSKKPLENNWPMFYWVAMAILSLRWLEDTWDFRFVLAGAAAGFMLRFEFMNRFFIRLFQTVEMCAWIYVLYAGIVQLGF